MKWKNLKITTKLTISTAVFLLPLGIMLFSAVSVSLGGIRKCEMELKGIETLRPAITLIQIIPMYVRLTVDETDGNSDFLRQYADELVNELIEKYEKNFGHEAHLVSMNIFSEYWEQLSASRNRDVTLFTYRRFVEELVRLVTYIGDISGLITDSELEVSHLVLASVHDLPQAQERIVFITNLLRIIDDGAFTLRRRSELERELTLLVYSDNARIYQRVSASSALAYNRAESTPIFDNLLRICYERILEFTRTVNDFLSHSELDNQFLPVLKESAGQINNSIFQLQEAALDRLEMLITNRIHTYRIRLILSVAAASLSTIAAFFFISFTIINIRKSTVKMSDIFGRLDKNDLTVQIESISQDELGEFMTALSGFLEKLKNAFSSFSKNAEMLSAATFELSSSGKEIVSTANEQSANVAEIVSTMENNKDLAVEAALKTYEVAELASHTQELSHRGAELREANEDMMRDILDQNAKITGIIVNLAEILSHIDESVQIIDSIADHTKLIAFNATLEASSSGEAGVRFAVVASEIRRFADNVVESVTEIKEKIAELQSESSNLITEAGNGTKAINEGYQRMVEQKEVFDSIVNVSQHVASHSQKISDLSKQQEVASSQVFSTLKEISTGIKQFVLSTTIASSAVDKLNNMSIELKETLAKYKTS